MGNLWYNVEPDKDRDDQPEATTADPVIDRVIAYGDPGGMPWLLSLLVFIPWATVMSLWTLVEGIIWPKRIPESGTKNPTLWRP